jgi:1-acyl-sn-glycerol-3-phosphate acyltransferase
MRRALRKAWHLTRVGAGFAYFWSGGAYLSWVYMPWVWHRAPNLDEARRRCQALLHKGFGVYLRFPRRMGIVGFDPAKVHLDLPDEPCVLVANHPTILDVVVLMALRDDLCTVVKDYYYQLPMVNRLLRYCGHINGGEGGLGWNAEAMGECLARLRSGQSLLFFPEGTRSPEADLHPFSRGGFEVARRAGVPLVPVLIRVSHPVLKRGVPWYRVPDRTIEYDVRALPARRIHGGRQASIAMARQVRDELAARLASLADVPIGADRGMDGPHAPPNPARTP